MTACTAHAWVAKIDLRQIGTRHVDLNDQGDGTVVVNVGSLIEEHIVEEYESKLVCRDCDTPYPDDVELEFQWCQRRHRMPDISLPNSGSLAGLRIIQQISRDDYELAKSLDEIVEAVCERLNVEEATDEQIQAVVDAIDPQAFYVYSGSMAGWEISEDYITDAINEAVEQVWPYEASESVWEPTQEQIDAYRRAAQGAQPLLTHDDVVASLKNLHREGLIP